MKIKRKDSFFGLHFDFHASEYTENIGENTTEEMITKIIDTANPDFIQCDAKGHPGYASYKTKLGNAAPGITKDALKIWRKVTNERDIPLYVHYSGMVDDCAAKAHPDWACRRENGEVSGAFDTSSNLETSLFSPYANELLIPQLKELYNEYGIDGVWIDGDCWGVDADYSDLAKAAYKSETGKDIPSSSAAKEEYMKYINFIRRSYIKYLNNVVDKTHESCPNMEIASNWAFSTYIPAPVCANVDFLSGDLPPVNSVSGARHEARYLSKQGKPWDLMAWSFNYAIEHTSRPYCAKSALQLCQEAAVVLAQGGGVQFYYTQEKDGSVWTDKLQGTKILSEFCKKRKPYCYKWQGIPQVAVLCSTNGSFDAEKKPFYFYDDVQKESRGIMECAIDSGFVVDFVSEHHLKDTMNNYAAIIVPEWEKIGNRDQLIKYAENGGGLIIIGKPTALFEDTLGIKLNNFSKTEKLLLRLNGAFAAVPDATLANIELKSAKQLLALGDNRPLTSVKSVGKGTAVGIYFDFGLHYAKHKSPILRKMLSEAINAVTDKIRLKVCGSQNLELTLTEKDGKTAINLINTSGPHSDLSVSSFDEIPSVGPLDIELKTDKNPKSVTLMPQNTPLEFTYEKGIMKTRLDKLEIYDIIVVE